MLSEASDGDKPHPISGWRAMAVTEDQSNGSANEKQSMEMALGFDESLFTMCIVLAFWTMG